MRTAILSSLGGAVVMFMLCSQASMFTRPGIVTTIEIPDDEYPEFTSSVIPVQHTIDLRPQGEVLEGPILHGILPASKPMAEISGPQVARVGDMPQFHVEFTGFEPILMQWTVEPSVSTMGEQGDHLGIATPFPGDYKVRLFAVDKDGRRLSDVYPLMVAAGAESELPPSIEKQSALWASDLETTEGAELLAEAMHETASLIRQREISTHQQLEATFEALLLQKLGPQAMFNWAPYLDDFNEWADKLRSRNKLRTIEDYGPLFDGAAKGLPIHPDA